MISYAQNLEDVLLDRVFAEVESGFYVDVGANDPDVYSITRHFYNHGWHGINIEPGSIFGKLARNRPRDLNLELAVSDTTGELSFHEYPFAHGLSTLEADLPQTDPELIAGRITRQVQVRPLRDIFAEFQPPQIDFLSIDVEGHERQVIRSNDWTTWRPRVVLVEATQPMHNRPTHAGWEELLLRADYRFAYFDGLNRYYVRREDESLLVRFLTPPNVFDRYMTAYTVELIDQVHDLAHRLGHLQRGTGARTLSIGLWVARQLHRMTARLKGIRNLLGHDQRRSAA
jgi:FkbM family methyltransferase